MENNKWKWKAGRLVRTRARGRDAETSYSTVEAYHLIPVDADIAEACDGVLAPYKEWRDDLRDLTHG
jgi:hypothetical protein